MKRLVIRLKTCLNFCHRWSSLLENRMTLIPSQFFLKIYCLTFKVNRNQGISKVWSLTIIKETQMNRNIIKTGLERWVSKISWYQSNEWKRIMRNKAKKMRHKWKRIRLWRRKRRLSKSTLIKKKTVNTCPTTIDLPSWITCLISLNSYRWLLLFHLDRESTSYLFLFFTLFYFFTFLLFYFFLFFHFTLYYISFINTFHLSTFLYLILFICLCLIRFIFLLSHIFAFYN